ncbi:MAG: response regulator transcription factor [Pseudobdellovibrionaceae bacterium]
MSLKDYRILILHGKDQPLSDIHQLFREHFAQITSTTTSGGLENKTFDLVVVNYSISDMTGILLYKEMSLAANHGLAPAIFIADTKAYDHRLHAFEIGAADFISRPFNREDLLKKCLLHLKNRRRIAEDQSIHVGNLSLYPSFQRVLIDGEPVTLTRFEYAIIYCLLCSPRQMVTRSEIYANVWGGDPSNSGRLDTQLYNLKKKLVNFNGKIKSVNKLGVRILLADSIFSQELKKQVPPSPSLEPHP